MKARNLFISFFAVLMFCYGSLALAADNVEQVDQVAVAELKVNINEADAETLAAVLDGVGMTRAHAIIAYRDENGPFYSAEELSAVRGIGMTTIRKNEGRILVQ